MKRLRFILRREKAGPDRTFGSLFLGQMWQCETMEPGNDDALEPRVDPGFYLLEPHGWDPGARVRFKRTWALVGKDVTHQPEPGVKRAAILIHAGNRDDETRGCVLVGLSRGMLLGEPALLRSRDAMERLRESIGPNLAELIVMDGG